MIELENRLICYLDVLGFSHQLSTVPIKELYKTYSDFIDEARNRTFYGTESTDGRTNFASAQIFSDSIILVSNKVDDVFNVNNFIGAIHFILEIGFKKNFPLRGAISIGNFILDKEREIFLSKCFPKIVKYESKQEWAGCVILEDAKDLIIESIFGKVALKEGIQIQGDLPIVKYNVPLKNGINEEKWCINFTFFLTREQIMNGIDYLINPKKENFEKYIEYLKFLPYQEQILGSEYYPAKGLKIMKTRSGMRLSFLDESGKPCKPGVDEIKWTVNGRWRD